MPKTKYAVSKTAEGRILKFDFEGSLYNPSIEDDANVMSQVIEAIAESGKVDEIMFTQNEEYIYDRTQTQILIEIAEVYNKLVTEERVLDFAQFGEECRRYFRSEEHTSELQSQFHLLCRLLLL